MQSIVCSFCKTDYGQLPAPVVCGPGGIVICKPCVKIAKALKEGMLDGSVTVLDGKAEA